MTVVLFVPGITLTTYVSGMPLMHPYRIMQLPIFSLAIIGWVTPNMAVWSNQCTI